MTGRFFLILFMSFVSLSAEAKTDYKLCNELINTPEYTPGYFQKYISINDDGKIALDQNPKVRQANRVFKPVYKADKKTVDHYLVGFKISDRWDRDVSMTGEEALFKAKFFLDNSGRINRVTTEERDMDLKGRISAASHGRDMKFSFSTEPNGDAKCEPNLVEFVSQGDPLFQPRSVIFDLAECKTLDNFFRFHPDLNDCQNILTMPSQREVDHCKAPKNLDLAARVKTQLSNLATSGTKSPLLSLDTVQVAALNMQCKWTDAGKQAIIESRTSMTITKATPSNPSGKLSN